MKNNNNSHEKELTILENIYNQPGVVRQRDLAEIAGLSLGMTNAILKRLALKGLLTIKRVNNRNIHYIVTPSGIEAITRKSYRYFKRTIKNVVYYKEAIEDLTMKIKKQGFDGLILKGASDLDFIVEHSCGKANLRYIKEDGQEGKIFLLYSENYLPDKEDQEVGRAFLQSILI
jgi:DNA-binding MarR family transcriptional regulator